MKSFHSHTYSFMAVLIVFVLILVGPLYSQAISIGPTPTTINTNNTTATPQTNTNTNSNSSGSNTNTSNGTTNGTTGAAGDQTTAPSSGSFVTLKSPLQGVNSISDLIFTFVKIVSYLAVILGVLMLMWVGMQFIMARGNPEEIKKRSNQLLWIVIGIAVIIGARIIVEIIINTLQATGTVNPDIIQNAHNAINSQ